MGHGESAETERVALYCKKHLDREFRFSVLFLLVVELWWCCKGKVEFPWSVVHPNGVCGACV